MEHSTPNHHIVLTNGIGDDGMLHSIQPEKEVQDAQLSDAQEINNVNDCMHDHNTISPVPDISGLEGKDKVALQDFETGEEHQRKEDDIEESLSDFESERGQQAKNLESEEELLNIQSTEMEMNIRILSIFCCDS